MNSNNLLIGAPVATPMLTWHFAVGQPGGECVAHGTVKAYCKGEAEHVTLKGKLTTQELAKHASLPGSVLRVGLGPQCTCMLETIAMGH